MLFVKLLKTAKDLSKAIFANLAFGFPSRAFVNIGITGTDGKTTTANLIYQILVAAGKPTGLITTLGAKIGDKDYDTGFHVTTPTPWPLQKFLRKMKKAGITHTVLEATSHGLHQHRLWGIPFKAGVITNITHEHLDYHKTMENYLKAKAKLIKNVKFAVLNRDDPSFAALSKLTHSSRHPEEHSDEGSPTIQGGSFANAQDDGKTHVVSYGLKEGNIRSGKISYSPSGTAFEIIFPSEKRMTIKTKLLGDYNVSNCLAATAAAWCLNIKPEVIKKGLENFTSLEGRFNIIDKGQKFTAVLDFAHTPAALEKVLKTARKVTKGKVIAVFGCAGLRDYQKRPVMGKIAGELADFTIVTAEDPRTEDLDKICQEIAEGFKSENYQIVKDRKEAIKTAFEKAKKGDLVLVTGKGHEKSMCFGKTEYPWGDREVIEEELEQITERR